MVIALLNTKSTAAPRLSYVTMRTLYLYQPQVTRLDLLKVCSLRVWGELKQFVSRFLHVCEIPKTGNSFHSFYRSSKVTNL